MLDTTTKKRIDDCRDILVGKLPDPKAQIEQITIALIYKFMDDMDKEAIELGGVAKFFSGNFEKYSWDNLFDTKVTATEMLNLYSDAIASMDKNPNIPQLFRDIFKNAFLPYRDPETLKMFLKTIGEFAYTHSEKLGDAFEYLLSVMGSQGDAGQFRTPRHIIDFLVAVVNPAKTDTILDPACGTAGFLISAFKYIMDSSQEEKLGSGVTPDDRRRIISNLTGYDISPDMVRLSLVNLYLHGFSDPHIYEYDTLSSEERWNETFDVILANPPFMSPKGGIRPHKKFSISSNRSEVLFVDYIAEHLNPGGKAGIIVPEGVIFQSGTAYKDLRKMLVENYLYAVVSLPAGVFNPYSGVKTSILLMDKEFAKTNEKILFVKIDNDGYGLGAQRNAVKGGQLAQAIEVLKQFKEGSFTESTLAHSVPKAEIAKNGDYNLSGERYKIVDIRCTSFDIISLGEIADVKGGKRLPLGSQYSENKTNHPYIRVADFQRNTIDQSDLKYISEEIHKEIARYTIKKEDVFLSIAGTIGIAGVIPDNLDGANLTENAAKLVIPEKNKLSNRYLSYILNSDKVQSQIKTLTHAVGVPKLAIERIRTIQIPLPPLSIQQEIVSEIESYQKIIDGAKMVVENYKPKIDIDEDWEMVELGEVAKPEYGFTEKAKNEGDARFIRITDIGSDGKLISTDEKYIDLTKEAKKCILKQNDVLLARTGATYGKTMIFEENYPAVFASFLIRLNFDLSKVFPKYYWVFAQSNDYIKQAEILMTGGGQPQFNGNAVVKIKLPLPDLNTQKKIVSRIEIEMELVNANKQLIEIFEQKIKQRIAKVWGTTTTENKTLNQSEPSFSIAAESDVEYGK